MKISSGSIGIAFSPPVGSQKLVVFLLRPRTVTPWDVNPVIGISRKLGFVFCDLSDGTVRLREMKALRNFRIV